tara:strand:+ start:4602 stop:4811 length:210 start_codon:yes stop_codon:yes gene_type:complete
MIPTYEVNLQGFELEVTAEIIKGDKETHDYPGTPDRIIIWDVLINGWQVTAQLSEDEDEEIERIILERQ